MQNTPVLDSHIFGSDDILELDREVRKMERENKGLR